MMKKLLFVCGMMAFGLSTASAQLDTDDYGIFNHVGIGVGLGTNGITIDASTVLTPYVGIRAGVNILPIPTINTDLDLGVEGANASISQYSGYINQINSTLPASQKIPTKIPETLDVEGKASLTTGHLLFDVYPFPKASSFRVTLGAYFGKSKIIKVTNAEDGALLAVSRWNAAVVNPAAAAVVSQYGLQRIGAELGDYFIAPNADGNIEASIKVNGFRPYLGIGFGRAVPKKRIGLQFDLGVQFWGSPKVLVDGINGEEELKEENAGGDAGGAIKTISKISVYPNLSLRLVGRIL